MDILKVKFKLNGLEFELEGNETTVRDELSIFKEFVVKSVLGPLSANAYNANALMSVEQPTDTTAFSEVVEENVFPVLKEVVMNDIPKSEIEWILIYSFYASDYGKNPFTEADIRNLYETSKRKNLNRMKNFSANFTKVVSGGYLRVLNETEYILAKKGLDRSKEILVNGDEGIDRKASKSSSTSGKKGKKTKISTAGKSNSMSIVSSLNFNPTNELSLKSFFSQYVVKTFFEKNLLFLYYVQKTLKLDNIGIDHIYTCYKGVSEKIPGNLYQSLVDTKNIKGWIDTKDISDLKLTVKGENAVEHDFSKA